MSYTKLFSSIIGSTIWQESKECKILWVTMLAIKNQHGIVEAAVPGLAKFAGLSLTETIAALGVLKAPDPYSRTQEHEGRRIEDCDGGWRVLNHLKYRQMESADDRREQVRLAQARFREKSKKPGKTKILRVERDPAKRIAKGLEPLVNEPMGVNGLAPLAEDHPGSFVQWQERNGTL